MKTYLSFAAPRNAQIGPEQLCVVLDCSPSMEATDYPPTRLEAGMAAICAMIDEKVRHCPDDTVAFARFAGSAQVVHPLESVKSHASSIKDAVHGVSTSGGTNITAGLECAAGLLGQPQRTRLTRTLLSSLTDLLCEPAQKPVPNAHGNNAMRRIILLSDGEHNTGPAPIPVASRLKSQGITIITIGIGGSPNEIDEATLKSIASIDPATKQPVYCFIADTKSLIREFKLLANHIRRAKEC
jgi:hypothetical protein